jgi:hypothetical protein
MWLKLDLNNPECLKQLYLDDYHFVIWESDMYEDGYDFGILEWDGVGFCRPKDCRKKPYHYKPVICFKPVKWPKNRTLDNVVKSFKKEN